MKSESSLHKANLKQSSDGQMKLRGVTTNNLKGIDVQIPHGSLTVITGPSGCGKSSLAIDTIYAEARRQFLDSLAMRHRQTFQYLPRPEIRYTEGLLPVVCIEQTPCSSNKRSTVATASDIYDYLRLLLARIGTVKCSQCQRTIDQTPSEKVEQFILGQPEGTRIMILASPVFDLGNSSDPLTEIRRAGYVRIRLNGEIFDLDSVTLERKSTTNTIDAIVDRIIVKPGIQDRVAESIAHALEFGGGKLTILTMQRDSEVWLEKRFSTHYSCPDCGETYEEIEPRTFSFYSPYGVCVHCEGNGTVEQFSFQKVFASRETTLENLGILQLLPENLKEKTLMSMTSAFEAGGFTANTHLNSISTEEMELLYFGNSQSNGLQVQLEKLWVTATNQDVYEVLSRFRRHEPCPKCMGSRLCRAANNVFIGGQNLGEIVHQNIIETKSFLETLPDSLDVEQQAIASPILTEIQNRLQYLEDAGVGYLTLDRRTDSLSGGEFQRIRLATGLGNRLTDVCYILDEPTTGLHPADNEKLIKTVFELRDLGNTVVIVEHDPEIMRIADFIIDLGPGSGDSGGQLLATGTWREICLNEYSLTGRFLSGNQTLPKAISRDLPPPEKWIAINQPSLNNLEVETFRFPTERLICVTGVSGSGKSSMVSGIVAPALRDKLDSKATRPDIADPFSFHEGKWNRVQNAELVEKVIEVSQQPIGRSPRSNAATFTGLFDEIRRVFASTRPARQLGYTASRFSFNNAEGACAACKGRGHQKLEMVLMPDLYAICPVCQGRRFNEATLSVRFKNRTIAEALQFSVDEANEFFQNLPRVSRILDALQKIGLGYLKLDQPANSLSGGEAQRLKIAYHLSRSTQGPALFIFDEPTSGLHFSDIADFQLVLQELVNLGHSVIVVEHNLELVKSADYVIDFGPGGGTKGGKIIAEGSPRQVSLAKKSLTGRHLQKLFAKNGC